MALLLIHHTCRHFEPQPGGLLDLLAFNHEQTYCSLYPTSLPSPLFVFPITTIIASVLQSWQVSYLSNSGTLGLLSSSTMIVCLCWSVHPSISTNYTLTTMTSSSFLEEISLQQFKENINSTNVLKMPAKCLNKHRQKRKDMQQAFFKFKHLQGFTVTGVLFHKTNLLK